MKSLKDKILDIMAREDAFFTGEELAARCGVTRAAVCKAAKELKQTGVDILTDRRRGYRLLPVAGLHPTRLLRALPWLGAVEVHDTLPSTNIRARALAEAGAPDGTVVIAHTQTAGRGRYDRRFESPAGGGLYLSYILRPQCTAELSQHITTCTAVAVAEAVEGLAPADVKIKWVNDLWVGTRKLCGILTEGAVDMEGGRLRYAVIGIGLNVRHADFPPPLVDIVTSVEDETGVQLAVEDVAVAVLRRLHERLATFTDKTHLEAYRRRSVLDGKRVHVRRGSEEYDALVRGIGTDGELLLTTDDGMHHSIASGEVVSVKL